MTSSSHGLRSEHLREDAYCAKVDQQLLAALRETLELQREVEAFTSGSAKQDDNALPRRQLATAS